MTAVMVAAEARRSASHMISSSIRLSFTGAHVGWTTKASTPRTFSPISQNVSPSLKRDTLASPSGVSSTLRDLRGQLGVRVPGEEADSLDGHRSLGRGFRVPARD